MFFYGQSRFSNVSTIATFCWQPLTNIVDSDFDYKLKEDILEDVIKNGVMCSLRMRFECTIMKSRSLPQKGQFDLAEEILDAEKDGLFKNHYEGESYCILNDVVVVSIYFLPTPRISTNIFFFPGPWSKPHNDNHRVIR